MTISKHFSRILHAPCRCDPNYFFYFKYWIKNHQTKSYLGEGTGIEKLSRIVEGLNILLYNA
jgi:hypothetical protein